MSTFILYTILGLSTLLGQIADWCAGLTEYNYSSGSVTSETTKCATYQETLAELTDEDEAALAELGALVADLETSISEDVYTYLTQAIGNLCLDVQALEEIYLGVWKSAGYKQKANEDVYSVSTPMMKEYTNAYVDGTLVSDYSFAEEQARLDELERLINEFVAYVLNDVASVERVTLNEGSTTIGNNKTYKVCPHLIIVDGKKIAVSQ